MLLDPDWWKFRLRKYGRSVPSQLCDKYCPVSLCETVVGFKDAARNIHVKLTYV